ncbi:transposase family protein [Marichromatium gracile]
MVNPRRKTRNELYALEDIVMLFLCTTLCGYSDWVGIEGFAHEHEE